MQRFFKSIEYIEQNMYSAINIHDIAAASSYSTYHFSRIFKSLVGDSPKEYLRKRRLTIAADRLLKEDVRILDLALECQFESQEAFTRSFKKLFNMTPGQYRSNKDPFRLIYKDQFSPHMLQHMQHRLATTPEIVTRPEMKTVGVAKRYTENDLELKVLWSAFKPYANTIPNRIGNDAFGIYEEYTETDDGVGFTYICSVGVLNFDDVPEGMIARTIAPQKYARFEHKGSVAFLEETLKYIWGSWLPKSGYEYVDRPDFELYSEGFNDADPENILQIYIPIKEQEK